MQQSQRTAVLILGCTEWLGAELDWKSALWADDVVCSCLQDATFVFCIVRALEEVLKCVGKTIFPWG